MRKFAPFVGLAMAIATLTLAVAIGTAHAQGPSSPTPPSSGSKQFPTTPKVTVADKHTTPSPLITSCPMPLPKPGIQEEGWSNSDPTYAYQSYAIGVTGGQAYIILAGYVRSKPTQGIVAVQPISLDPCKDFVSQLSKSASSASMAMPVWNVPSQDGVIKFTEVSGNMVSFTAAGGKAGHFDYATKAFLP